MKIVYTFLLGENQVDPSTYVQDDKRGGLNGKICTDGLIEGTISGPLP